MTGEDISIDRIVEQFPSFLECYVITSQLSASSRALRELEGVELDRNRLVEVVASREILAD